jgi:uncharacterized protein YgiM (DUF1202 family)
MLAVVLLPLMSLAQTRTGTIINDKVLFRMKPSQKSSHYGFFRYGEVVEILGTKSAEGYTWYNVRGTVALKDNIGTRMYEGYVRGDMIRENTGGTVQPAVTTAPDTQTAGGYIRITQTNTNLRASMGGSSIMQMAKGIILPYYGQPTAYNGYNWVYAQETQSGRYGYVRSDCYEFVDSQGNASQPGTSGGVVVTSKPEGSEPVITTSTTATVTKHGANLRQTPAGLIGLYAFLQGDKVTVTGPAQDGWYPVTYDKYSGYMSVADIELDASPGPAVAPPKPDETTGTTPTGGVQAQGYITINAKNVNFRDKPNGSSLLWLQKGDVLPYYGQKQFVNGIGWQYAYYAPGRVYGYVHQDYFYYSDGSGGTATQEPAATEVPDTSSVTTGYIALTKSGVNLRTEPGGKSLKQLALGTVLPFSGNPIYYGGYSWVYVTDVQSGLKGYVRSDCYNYVDSQGNVTDAPAPATPTPQAPVKTPEPSVQAGKLTLIKGGVNLRIDPAGSVIAQLDRGTTLNYYGSTTKNGYLWYYVYSDKGTGYIRGDMVKIENLVGPEQPDPTAPPEVSVSGYIILTKGNVNLRKTPAGLSIMWLQKDKIYPITGPIIDQGGYLWYFVSAEGHTGYLRSDCVRQLTDAEVAQYLAGQSPGQGTVTPPPTASGYVKIDYSGTNLRNTPSTSGGLVRQVGKGTVLPYLMTMTSGGTSWYLLSDGGVNVYVMAKYAHIMSAEEVATWLGTQTPGTPTPAPGQTPLPGTASDLAVTVMDNVLMRKEGSMKALTLTKIYRQGTHVRLMGSTVQNDGYTWYSIYYSGMNGYIRGDMIRILTQDEVSDPGDTGDKPTATYRTLRRGMSGDDVARLQAELIKLGVLEPTYATGIYNQQTEEAVKAYQRSTNGELFVDGIAGQKTQDAIFGTVPPSQTPIITDTTIYPVELVDWYTGDIQSAFPKGAVATITDVKTGLSFNAKRWSGGYHADCEPLTAQDTAIYNKIYGVNHSQEINEKDMWQRRPLWVTIGGRTFAASLYGVPHNYPAGDTIPDNDFNGQFCVHFVNSRVHRSGVVDAQHQAAIQYAYDHAPVKAPLK